MLVPVRKGLYIVGPSLHTYKPEPFLLANHILGPSYISTDAALSYYGLIPERVYELSSMTTKASRVFNTAIGKFTYTRLPLPYYAFGIRREKLADKAFVLMASPEKALFDKVITTAGRILRSKKATLAWLLEDLRIDENSLKEFDTQSMLTWITDAPKKQSLQIIIKTIAEL